MTQDQQIQTSEGGMKPKMQLSPGDYVTAAFRAEINAWMIDFFGYEDDEAITNEPQITQDVEPRVTKAPKAKRTKRTRTQVAPDTATFSGLLEGLEESFYTMQVPPITGSWLAKKDLNAIKKMGIYVPTPLTVECPDQPTIGKGVPFTAIASAYFVPRKYDEKNKNYPRFAFCIRAQKLPEGVEFTRGTPYQFGQCYEMRVTEDGKDMPPRTFWAWCWIVVTPSGEIRIPHEMRKVQTVIKSSRKGKSKSPKLAVLNSRWCLPTMAVAEAGFEQNAFEHSLKCTFRQLLLWWQRRDNQWSVGVRRDGHRVVFSVAREHTSAYFADRETVVNVDGKPRKIIHFVREHQRAGGAVVKAHVRGLREFDWKGYHCVVTAPKLKGNLFTQMPIAPIEVDGEIDGDDFVATDAMAEMMAELEDAT